VSSARTILAGGKGSSSSTKHEWVPLLPEARAALLPVLLHVSQPDLQQGVMATAAVVAEAAAHARSKQQGHLQSTKEANDQPQAASKKKKGGAASSSSNKTQTSVADSSSSCDYTPLLELSVVNGWLAAVLDLLQQQESEGRLDAAAASTAGHAAASLMGQLMGQQLPLLGGKTTTSSSSSSGEAVLPALVVPDAASYALLVRLFGAAGQYDRVAGLVSAALRGQLPLATTTGSSSSSSSSQAGSWPAAALQAVLAAAVAVWAAAGRPGLGLAMLDGLPAAGMSRLDCPQLAAALLAVDDPQVCAIQ
jgi:hypothetical protein